MKKSKKSTRKLNLSVETVRILTNQDLVKVAGGDTEDAAQPDGTNGTTFNCGMTVFTC